MSAWGVSGTHEAQLSLLAAEGAEADSASDENAAALTCASSERKNELSRRTTSEISDGATASTLVTNSAAYSLDDSAGITLRWNIKEDTNANDWIGLYLYSEADASKWIDYRNKGVNGAKEGEIVWKFAYIAHHFPEPKTEACFRYYHGNTGRLRAATGPITITNKWQVPRPPEAIDLPGAIAAKNYFRFVIKDIEAVHLRKGLFFNPDPYIKMWLEPAANARLFAVHSRPSNVGAAVSSRAGANRHRRGLLAHHRRKYRTSVCNNTTAPAWPHQEFAFCALPTDVLYMKLIDKFVSSRPTLNRYLGHVVLPVITIQETAKAGVPLTIGIMGRSPTDNVSGTICLHMDLINDSAAEHHSLPLRKLGYFGSELNTGSASSSDDESITQHWPAFAKKEASREQNKECKHTLVSSAAEVHGDSRPLGAREDSGDESWADSNEGGLSSDDDLLDDHPVQSSGTTEQHEMTGSATTLSMALKGRTTAEKHRSDPRKDEDCRAPQRIPPSTVDSEVRQRVQQVHKTLGRSPSTVSACSRDGQNPRGSTAGLPVGWSTEVDSCGHVYYVDRINKTASWTRPDENRPLSTSWRNSVTTMSFRSLPVPAHSDDPSGSQMSTGALGAEFLLEVHYQDTEALPDVADHERPSTNAGSASTLDTRAGMKDEGDAVGASSALSKHPALSFLTSSEFFTFVQGDDVAQKQYMDSPALKQAIQAVRVNPSMFRHYERDANLVNFVNMFALIKNELPSGWERKADRDGKYFFVNDAAKWTTYCDPRLPMLQAPVQPPSAAPQRLGRYRTEVLPKTSCSEYESRVLAFLRQVEAISTLESRWPTLKKNEQLKRILSDIIADGASALRLHRDNVHLTTMLSLFEKDIMTYTAPAVTSSDNSVPLLSDLLDDGCYSANAGAHQNTAVPQHKRGFQEKYRLLLKKLKAKGYGAGPRKIKLRVRRDNILQDAFNAVMSYNKKDLQTSSLLISFSGEEGLDLGGPAREFYFLFSRELFNPYYGLFEYSAYDTYTVQINPASQYIDNAPEWFRFAGRMLGLGIVHQYLMDCYFTRPFYKMLLTVPCSLDDLESLDSEFYQSLVWIRDNNITSCGLDLTFSVDEEAFGQIIEHELKPGGKSIAVTERNKKDYIERVAKWRVSRGITEQMKNLLKGFHEVLNPKLIAIFDAKELELVIAGTAEIDVDEWRQNTEYRSGYHANHPVIKRFWKCVETFNNDQRLRLLQFATGTSSLPFEGFAALRGSHEPRRFAIEQWGSTESLPRAHTCFNRLDLPPYRNVATLREKLLVAVEETGTFGLD